MRKFQVGDSASLKIMASDEVVRKIAEVSGDNNPVHLEDGYAKKTIFKRKIAHGLFCVNGISRLLGTVLPGNGTILLSQLFKYKFPVYIDDCIEITVKIKDIKYEKNIYTLDIVCANQNGQVVMEGESVVKWEEL